MNDDEELLNILLGRGGTVRPGPRVAGVQTGGTVQTPNILAQPNDEEEISITGWKPRRKAGWLGQIIDTLKILKGKDAPFQGRKDQHDIEDAMKHFSTDPVGALQRIRQINPSAGWKMTNEYEDNQRADKAQESLAGTREDKAHITSLSILGGADEKSYPQMVGLFNRYRAGRGLDPIDLPETFDPDFLTNLLRSGVAPDKQFMIDYRNKRLPQFDRALDISEGRAGETARHNVATEGQAVTNEGGRNARNAASIAARPNKAGEGRIGTLKKPAAGMPAGTRLEFSPSGKTARTLDGKRVYRIQDGKLLLIREGTSE